MGKLRLHTNENRFSHAYLTELNHHYRDSLENIINYPNSISDELANTIAAYHGIQPESIYFGNGLDEVIATLVLLFSREGDRIIYPEKTFCAYQESVKLFHRIPIVCRMSNFRIDMEDLLSCIKQGAKMVFVCNPHNPTGTALNENEIRTIMEACEQYHTILVIDEAYVDYYCETVDMHRVTHSPYLFMLRTFSKFYSMSGLRLGYAVSSPENIKKLHTIKQALPYNINHIAQQLACKIFRIMNRSRKTILDEFFTSKKYLYDQLDLLGIPYIKSFANFVTVDLQRDTEPIMNILDEQYHILVRSCNTWNMKTYMRITIGTIKEMNAFICALKKVLCI